MSENASIDQLISDTLGTSEAQSEPTTPQPDDPGTAAPLQTDDAPSAEKSEPERPADPRIAHYRALADARIVERDREIYQLRAKLAQHAEPTDWKERAKLNPRAVAEELGISLDSLIDAYAGGSADDAKEKPKQFEIPKEIEEKLSKIAELEAKVSEIAKLRRDQLRAEIDSQAERAIETAALPLSTRMGPAAVALAHSIRVASIQLYGHQPGYRMPSYEDLAPLVEQGLREQYPKLAEALDRTVSHVPSSTVGAKSSGSTIESIKSGSAGTPAEPTPEQRMEQLIRETLSD